MFYTFPNLKSALQKVVDKDRKLILLRHVLEKGEEIRKHYHPKVAEWVILYRGKAEVSLGEKNCSIEASERKVVVVQIPAGEVHSLKAKEKCEYLVVREGEDETVYV